MAIRYFVSYAHGDARVSGFGNAEMTLDKPVRSAADVTAIARSIEGTGRAQKVTVLAWQRFEDAS
jgi:hypothetical protein